MKRQELRTGKHGEYEFQFWECWESDPHNPTAPERHFFRAITGMEASTADEMMERLSGKVVSVPNAWVSDPDPQTLKRSPPPTVPTAEAPSDGTMSGTAFVVSHDGKLVTGGEPAAVTADPAEDPSPMRGDGSDPRAALFRRMVSDSSEDREDPTLDARTEEEKQGRTSAFFSQHPWLWQCPDGQPPNDVISDMWFVWWAEQCRFVFPERYAAALDEKKYRKYMEKYGYTEEPSTDWEESEEEDGDEEEEERSVAPDAPRCQFIKANGNSCGSPALKRRRFCHFHSKTADERKRKNRNGTESRPEKSVELELPVLEDDLAIQMAVSNVCRQLANERIDPKRATSLLYGLQVAAVAVRRTAQKRS